MKKILLLASVLALASCSDTKPVDRPCGVITDPLGDVRATTKEGNKRIDANFEAGVRAGCWSRDAAGPDDALQAVE